jgi:hypothetical protein
MFGVPVQVRHQAQDPGAIPTGHHTIPRKHAIRHRAGIEREGGGVTSAGAARSPALSDVDGQPIVTSSTTTTPRRRRRRGVVVDRPQGRGISPVSG